MEKQVTQDLKNFDATNMEKLMTQDAKDSNTVFKSKAKDRAAADWKAFKDLVESDVWQAVDEAEAKFDEAWKALEASGEWRSYEAVRVRHTRINKHGEISDAY